MNYGAQQQRQVTHATSEQVDVDIDNYWSCELVNFWVIRLARFTMTQIDGWRNGEKARTRQGRLNTSSPSDTAELAPIEKALIG